MISGTPKPDQANPDRAPEARAASHRRSPAASAAPAPAFKQPGSTAYPETVQRLIDQLARLPGIGRRSAERLAFHILKSPAPDALQLAQAITDVKRTVRHCSVCFNLADADSGAPAQEEPTQPPQHPVLCSVCRSPSRDRSVVMVVEQPKDLIALEQTGMYKGIYHVLMGRISPLDGVGPGDLTIDDLLKRIQDPSRNAGGEPVREVVLALNPTLEADGTALYVAQQLASRKFGSGVKVTRLARGIPTGTQLEYANKAVLADAIEGRQPMG